MRRFDLRVRYTDLPNGAESATLILRLDRSLKFTEHLRLNTRLELPTIYSARSSRDNPNGDYEIGLGDIVSEQLFACSIDEHYAAAFGMRTLIPTATADQFGSGRLQLLPTLSFRRNLPEISAGSFVAFTLRYATDVAGDDDQSHIWQFQGGPILHLKLPQDWFFTLGSSADWKFNLMNDKWFIPLDLTLGRKLSQNVVCSLQLEVPIVDDDPNYDFKVEVRIGFSF